MSTLQELESLLVQIINDGPEKSMNEDVMNKIDSLTDQCAECSEEAREIIVRSITEQRISRAITMAERITVASMVQAGDRSMLPVLAKSPKSLDVYTHNIVMAVIGALIRDEVL